MNKSIIIIVAVAILGGGGIYAKSHNADADNIAIKGANTTTQTTQTADTNTTASPTSAASSTSASSGYKDGTYTGQAEETAYGIVQVVAIISSGKITDVQFLQMPDAEGHSREVTDEAEAPLRQSALVKQTAHIDFVSGATQTSEGYQLSLQSALDKAS